MPTQDFWQWLTSAGYIQGDPNYYTSGGAQAGEYAHAFTVAWAAIQASGDKAAIDRFWTDLVSAGYIQGDPNYYASGAAQAAEYAHAFDVADEAALATPTAATAPAAAPSAASASAGFWQGLVSSGYIQGDPAYYSGGSAQAGEYVNAFTVAWNAISTSGDQAAKDRFWTDMVSLGYIQGDPAYYASGAAQAAEYTHAFTVAEAAALGAQPGMSPSESPSPEAVGTGPGTVGGVRVPDIPPVQRQPTVDVGTPGAEATIPTGMRLVRVTGPAGADAGEQFYLVGTVFGVEVSYLIGDRAAVNATFGGVGYFSNLETLTQTQYDASDVLDVGMVDEVLGATGSLQAQYERDMRAAGLEAPPSWLATDTNAMATYVTSINEGWSAEHMWTALSSTAAFKKRFVGLDVVKDQLGTTSWVESITEYTTREDAIRTSILSNRGPSADTSPEYVSSLIASGWQAAEVGELLALEKRVKDNPEALDNINQILAYQGIEPLGADDFISFLQDQDALTLDPSYTPSDVFEGVNDALRFQALLTEGIDIDLGLASELGTGTSETIGSEEQFSRQAQLAASFIGANARELDFGKMGLERDDIVAAMFGETREGGRPVSEVNALLEQFARERTKAGQGFTTVQSYINSLGRPVTQGFSDLA